MSYAVFVTANAKGNLRHYYDHAARQAPDAAARWLDRFEAALATLSENPERCALAPENQRVAPEVRQLLFGKGRSVFRVLFTIVDDHVRVLHIRRGTMDVAEATDLME